MECGPNVYAVRKVRGNYLMRAIKETAVFKHKNNKSSFIMDPN
jgi:hypothetical protein